MCKIGLHVLFEYLKHKLWPKERLGVKVSIWFLTTKSQELPWFIWGKWCVTYLWKTLDKGYNFFLRLYFDRKFSQKIMGLQNCKNLNFENFEIPNLKVLKKNDIWVQA
jgi:hypothetical protein